MSTPRWRGRPVDGSGRRANCSPPPQRGGAAAGAARGSGWCAVIRSSRGRRGCGRRGRCGRSRGGCGARSRLQLLQPIEHRVEALGLRRCAWELPEIERGLEPLGEQFLLEEVEGPFLLGLTVRGPLLV